MHRGAERKPQLVLVRSPCFLILHVLTQPGGTLKNAWRSCPVVMGCRPNRVGGWGWRWGVVGNSKCRLLIGCCGFTTVACKKEQAPGGGACLGCSLCLRLLRGLLGTAKTASAVTHKHGAFLNQVASWHATFSGIRRGDGPGYRYASRREPDASRVRDGRQRLALQAGRLAHPDGLEAQRVNTLALWNSSVPMVICVL